MQRFFEEVLDGNIKYILVALFFFPITIPLFLLLLYWKILKFMFYIVKAFFFFMK